MKITHLYTTVSLKSQHHYQMLCFCIKESSDKVVIVYLATHILCAIDKID